MGNVHMEAAQINYRGGEKKMSVEEAIKNAGSSYELPIASAETLGGVKIGSGISIAEGGAISADAQLPADPETDGTKVLTATTTSGETVLSWENPASGGVDYSTTEQNTGLKWIDGKDIYQITIDCGTLPNNSYIGVNAPTIGTLVDVRGVIISTIEPTNQRIIPFVGGGTNDIRVDMTEGSVKIVTYSDWTLYTAYLTLQYTKPAL